MGLCMGGLEEHSSLLLAFQQPELTHVTIPAQERPGVVIKLYTRQKGIISDLCQGHLPVSGVLHTSPCKVGLKSLISQTRKLRLGGIKCPSKATWLISVRVRLSPTSSVISFILHLSHIGV